jgi:hypothetical protein
MMAEPSARSDSDKAPSYLSADSILSTSDVSQRVSVVEQVEVSTWVGNNSTEGEVAPRRTPKPVKIVLPGEIEVPQQQSRRVLSQQPKDMTVRIWAQCEKCSVWRRMAVGVKQWDGVFECSMNNWDRYNECGMPEEEMDEDESEDDLTATKAAKPKQAKSKPKLKPKPKTESKADVRIWAQCEKCSVWRRMAVGVKQWDGDFECSMNNWDRYNECGMPEEEMGEDESEDDADTKRKKNASRVSPKKRQKVGGKDADTKKAAPRKKKRKRAARVWVQVPPQSVSTRYILSYWPQQ